MWQETLKREVGASAGKSGFRVFLKILATEQNEKQKTKNNTVHTGMNQRTVCCEAEMIERLRSYTFMLHIIFYLVFRFRCSHSSSEMRNKS